MIGRQEGGRAEGGTRMIVEVVVVVRIRTIAAVEAAEGAIRMEAGHRGTRTIRVVQIGMEVVEVGRSRTRRRRRRGIVVMGATEVEGEEEEEVAMGAERAEQRRVCLVTRGVVEYGHEYRKM